MSNNIEKAKRVEIFDQADAFRFFLQVGIPIQIINRLQGRTIVLTSIHQAKRFGGSGRGSRYRGSKPTPRRAGNFRETKFCGI